MAEDTPQAAGAEMPDASPFSQVPLEIKISVGHARPMIRDLMRLTHDSVLPLDRRIDDPVELFVGDRLIARGTLEELEDGEESGHLAVRLIEIVRGADDLT
ncbi:MAG: FliM/FliN family flagellar motor C-terminal domain-containing protein [Pseudomonadota bacterium]